MAFLGLLYVLAAWTWVQLLPGWFVSRWIVPDATAAERAGIALLCAWSVVPLGLFLLAVAASVPMDATFLGLFSTAINVVGALDRRNLPALRADWRLGAAFLGLAVVCGVVLAYGLRSLDGGDVFSTVHHCLYVIVMHTIANDPSVAVPMYDGASDSLIHYLVHHQTGQFNGLAPLFFEQRLGNAPILAPSVALFGTAGWWWTSATTAAAIIVFVFLCARAVGASTRASGFAAAVFGWGIQSFCLYFVNENTYAVTLTAALLWGTLSSRRSLGWLVLMGIATGHLVGVRYTSVLMVPAVMWGAWWRTEPRPERARKFAVGAVAFAVTVVPWLYVNSIMLDDPFTHPKIHVEHEGRVVQNALLGWTFEFRALNWPFIDTWSRTAWNPFPTLVWFPLQVGRSFGQLAVALALLGVVALRGRRRALALSLAFAVPHTLAMVWLETLDWEQLTYAAPGLVPLGLWLAVGIDRALAAPARDGALAVVILGLLVGAGYGVRGLDRPIDRRMLERVDAPDKVNVGDGRTVGVELVAEGLTTPRPWPAIPVIRTAYAENLWGALSHLPSTGVVEGPTGPLYPSGQVAVLAGYSQFEDKSYEFSVEPRAAASDASPVRTSLGLHQVSLTFQAERLDVSIVRRQGLYTIDVTPQGTSATAQDFTFWLHPWMPPIETINITSGGKPIPDLRILEYGGSLDFDQLRFIVTNYPAATYDVVEVPFTVDVGEQPVECGLFLFLGRGSDPEQVETLVLAGGHDTFWFGEPTGVLRIPRGLDATSLVLYADPTCSTHTPQPGDRWARVDGPFDGQPLHFELSRHWKP